MKVVDAVVVLLCGGVANVAYCGIWEMLIREMLSRERRRDVELSRM